MLYVIENFVDLVRESPSRGPLSPSQQDNDLGNQYSTNRPFNPPQPVFPATFAFSRNIEMQCAPYAEAKSE